MGNGVKDLISCMAETLAERIRKAREAAGLTQAQLAQMVGSKSGRAGTVSDWEAGRLPNAETIAELPAVLGVDGHWLLTGEGPMRRTDPSKRDEFVDRVARMLEDLER